MTRVAIIGAGIGGLTAAIALRHRGIEVDVYERHETIRPAGAGIMLWGDTLDALDRLGLGEHVSASGGVVDRSEFRDPNGQPIAGLWLGSFIEKDLDDRPPVCLHRALLHKTLIDALGSEHVTYGAEFEEFTVDDGQVSIQFGNADPAVADILIGADGINSQVRMHLFPDASPCYDGQTIYRGVADHLPGPAESISFVAIGEGCRFGWEPLGDGSIYWFGGRFQPEDLPDGSEGRTHDLLTTFGSWASPVPELIESTEEGGILRNDVYTVGPLQAWGRGPVTLLGDAAHAISPHIGQGACLAIDDAEILAAELEHDRTTSALRRYETRRRDAMLPIYDKAAQLRSGLESGRLVEDGARTGRQLRTT